MHILIPTRSWSCGQPAGRVDQVFREGLWGGIPLPAQGKGKGASPALCGQSAPGGGTERAKALRWAEAWCTEQQEGAVLGIKRVIRGGRRRGRANRAGPHRPPKSLDLTSNASAPSPLKVAGQGVTRSSLHFPRSLPAVGMMAL